MEHITVHCLGRSESMERVYGVGGSFGDGCVGRLLRWLGATIGVALVVLSPQVVSRAYALDKSKTPAGNNHAAAHALATGSGVKVGVIEFSNINPGLVNLDEEGRLIKILNFRNTSGVVMSDPTDAPYYQNNPTHTANVAKIIADSNATYTGVAPAAMVYSGAASSYSQWFSSVDWLYRGHGVALFHFSMGVSGADNDNGTSTAAMIFDYHIRAFDTLIVGAAGNDGSQIDKPWDFYNGLTVGAVDSTFRARASYSDYLVYGESGSTVNWRPKPEVVAPGTVTVAGGGGGSGTSYSAPHVTGIAALLQQGTPTTPGLELGTAGQSNHLAIKAIIMNSARKRNIVTPEDGYPYASDYSGNQVSDGNYLNGTNFRSGSYATAPKTTEWTPSEWSYANGVFTTQAPLDDEVGAGVADARRALIQLDGGRQGPGQVGVIGWDIGALASNASSNNYVLNASLEPYVFLTATLVWDRPIAWTDSGSTPGYLEYYGDSFTAQPIPDLALRVYYCGSLYAESNGTYNVEHLHIPLINAGIAGDWVISVAGLSGVNNTAYSLAWWTVPEPGTAAMVVLGMVSLLRSCSRRQRR